MTTRAYNQLYLSKSSRVLGNMLHDAVVEFKIDGQRFLEFFVQSGVAKQFEEGNPKYIAGKSGLELFLEVIEKTTGKTYNADFIETFDRDEVYWVGWILAHYQWYSSRPFKEIIETVSYNDFLCLYPTLHEADIQKSYEVLDMHFFKNENKLKIVRQRCGLTQKELAEKAGIPLSTLRGYEYGKKDISKAGAETVIKLINVLKCDFSDLLDKF